MDEQATIDTAVGLHRAGRLDEAARLYDSLIRADPAHADALHLRGVVAYQQGDDARAIELIRRAIDAGIEGAPPNHHLATALLRQRRLDEAEAGFRRALDADAGHAGALGGLGETLLGLGRAAEATPLFEKAAAAAPGEARWHCGLADALHAGGHLAEAADAYERAVALDPNQPRAWWGLGCVRAAQEEYAPAAAALTRLVRLVPDHGEAVHNLGKALFKLGQVDAALEAFRRAAPLLPNPEPALGAIATIIPGSPAADNQAVLDARHAWAERLPSSPARAGPARRSGRPLRVGYLSSFFQDRNWMKPVWGLINHHDRDRFEIHLFSDAPRSRVEHGYEADPRDHFHDLSGLPNAQAAPLIERQGLDLLVDLNAYSRPDRLAILALRPAPVVVAWFNMFATSGMGCFDALIGDGHVLPSGEERFYTERVVRVPGCYLTFEVTYPVPDVGPAPCAAGGRLTFGCLAPLYKITPEVTRAWSRVLQACPASRLVVKNAALASRHTRDFVYDVFGRSGVSPERLALSGPAEHYEFLATYGEIDVALDTFPYNGGTTTMEALWQGVPVLTFTGDRWAARISASLLRNAGLDDFVASDLDGFVAKAVDLAHDPGTARRLDELRRGMRRRLAASKACDVRGFARDMEAVYEGLCGERGRERPE